MPKRRKTEPHPVGRRSPSGAERHRDAERSRARLLDAALEEFSRHGFAGTRVQDIAARAGVNAQLISYYFGGKDGLYQALYEGWLQSESAFADPQLSLQELLSAYLRAVLGDPRRARLLLWAGLSRDPDAHDGQVAQGAVSHDVEQLKRRQQEGEIAPDLDPEIFQIAIMGLILAPLSLPQVVHELTGLEPTDPRFARRFEKQLATMLRHLAG